MRHLNTYAVPPIEPVRIEFDLARTSLVPRGPALERRMSDLDGLFARGDLQRAAAGADDPVVYTVVASLVPEVPRELPQSITTIHAGSVGGEFHMTKGHQHPDPQAEIYLGLAGTGGLLMFDGERTAWLDMAEGTMGYIPPGWAHRSVNTGTADYRFLAIYPGSAGHDYAWVLRNGMGQRAFDDDGHGVSLRPYDAG